MSQSLHPTLNNLSPTESAYTHAPPLHRNLILGSLHLLFWLFFHPSAWQSYVRRIAPTLRPDFFLVEVRGADLQNPALRRLLVMTYSIIPILIGVFIGLVLWVCGLSSLDIMGGVALSVMLYLTLNCMAGLIVSVASGTALGLAGSLAGAGTLVAMGGSVTAATTFNAIIVAVSLVGSIGSSVAANVTVNRDYPITRQFGAISIVFLICVATAIVAYSLPVLIAGARYSTLGGAMVLVEAGIAISIAIWWRTRDLLRSILIGLGWGAIGGVAGGMLGHGPDGLVWNTFTYILFAAMSGLSIGVALGSGWYGICYALGERIAGAWAGAIASAVGTAWGGVVFVVIFAHTQIQPILPFIIVCLLGLTLAWWRPVLCYPFFAAYNLLLFRSETRRDSTAPRLLRRHSAFWDEHQRLRLYGLEDHLVLVAERDPDEGKAAIEHLSTSHQRWAAQAAQTELDARQMEQCKTVEMIARAHRIIGSGELEQNVGTGKLADPATAFLRSFRRISLDVGAALHQESAYNQRLALSAVEDRLDGLLREFMRSREHYAVRFQPIANSWRQVVADHVRALAEAVEQRQEIDSPYVIGVPLTDRQEIFVGRTDVIARLEQLLLDRRRPPLLLYGQRRMGKTSLLYNLGRLLPSTIVPLFVDLQGVAAQSDDHAGLLYNIARSMVESAEFQRNITLPYLDLEDLSNNPFTRFNEWIDQVEEEIGADKTALLTLDEFEVIDNASGRFDQNRLLGMLRHLIQHRRRFKVLLAGAHTLDELSRWASYLINVQVVPISYLKETEALKLIEHPVEDFALRYEEAASRRVLALTRGHPFLIQLLCAEIVALKNEQDPAERRLARLKDVEAAIPEALQTGSLFFSDIQENRVDERGRQLLRSMAAHGEGAVVRREAIAQEVSDDSNAIVSLLLRRDLIEPVDRGYRFQVELIRRWFVK